MVNLKKILSIVLSLCMLLSLASVSLAEAPAAEASDEAAAARDENTLIIAYTEFNEKFSPFYAETSYDVDVAEYVGDLMMNLDRLGSPLLNGIEGETTSYNGTDYTYTGMADLKVEYDETADLSTYTVKLRDDITFSDGEPVTADDVIFSYYVFLDPAYVGPTTLNSYDIVGLKAYQTQTPEDIYNKYDAIASAIFAKGLEHEWAEGNEWTKEQQEAFRANLQTAWTEDVQDIVNYVVANYNTADYAPEIGSTPEEISANEGLQVALGMAMWGFASFDQDAGTLSAGDKTWTLKDGDFPTIEDYYAETYAAYEGNPDAFFGTEAVDTEAKSTLATAQQAFIQEQGKNEPEAAAGVPNIAGIKKVDDHTVQMTMKGFSAPAIYQVFGITLAPLHYYGDKAQYDYDNNQFGFPFGDLSIVEAKTTQPLGAGPYKFVKYENKVVFLEANENYYKGEPKIKYIQLKETMEPDRVPGVLTGTVDISEPSFSTETVDAIKEANGGELSGSAVRTTLEDFPGYGFVGVTATNVNVGGEPASEASKNLRRAIFTAIALYRDVGIDSYYGEAASVINYPISNTSWAAPQKTDADYKVAFSVDVEGNDIYTADMDMAQREEAALKAIVDFLKAAGYTYDEATGLFTAAPEGAFLEYEAMVNGYGSGAHPSFGSLTDANGLLAKVGFTLTINDTSDFGVFQQKVKSGNAQLFCMAWQSTNSDPDMYQIYHSSNLLGAGGTDSNHYMLADAELDQLIMDGRSSPDQLYRKAVYKAALDKIIDWAVELPMYQRKTCTIFSEERIKLDTLTPDISTWWKYRHAIQLLEMK